MPAAQTQSGVNFPAALKFADLPPGNLQGASIIVKSGGAQGHIFHIAGVIHDLVMIGFGMGHFEAMAALRAGDEIQIDNSIYLATQTFHRHQIPRPEYYVWNQYKGTNGKPLYPQRTLLPGQEVQSGGATQSGRFHGKVIVMQALWDEAAYPWSADWYRTRVKAALGPLFEDRYRLWYVDNTMHTAQSAGPNDPRPVVTTRVISYQGVLQQALRDLVAWVEKGVAPPESTAYQVVDGQVVVPATASERKVCSGGECKRTAACARVKVGEAVEFTAVAEAPAKAGLMVKAEWDFEGTGEYPVPSEIKPQSRVAVTTNYAFAKPGAHFPALRVTSNRLGDARSPYAQVQNLGRVRGSSPERIPFAGGRAQPPGAYETEELRKFMLEPVAGNFPICCGMETAAGFLFLNQQFSGFT